VISPRRSRRSPRGSTKDERFQTLLGITGSGKSATIAWTIEQVQRPTLVLAPNKSLAAQLAQEMREFFPHNRVEYFVSYYDYYQPEAYIPSSDTYIEKDSSINDEIDRLRHSATAALLTRRDVIVVASVSCIYGMGNPEEYKGQLLDLNVGVDYDMRAILRRLVDLQYDRNDMTLGRGKFRVRGDTIEVHPAYEESVLRVEMFGDTIDRLTRSTRSRARRSRSCRAHDGLPGHPLRGRRRADARRDGQDRDRAAGQRLAELEEQGKLLEAQRLRMRTQYDLEMMAEVGYCNGIENYSMHIDGRDFGDPPFTLLDYFPDDYLLVIDESHVAVPQLHGQYAGDRSRKDVLVEHGFRLPSARDNRPLTFDEVLERINQCVFLSATPSEYELRVSSRVVEQIVRPTGLVDPEVIVKPTKGQIDDLMEMVGERVARGDRVLVTTLDQEDGRGPHRLPARAGPAGALPALQHRHDPAHRDPARAAPRRLRRARRHQPAPRGPRPARGVAGLHPRRRQGGLPAQETSLIQTIGRAARNVGGQVVMYADTVTDSMRRRSTRPNAGGRSSSRTTSSTGSTRRRSARPSATSSRCSVPTTAPRRCPGRIVVASASATRCSAS
jgi:excinuclease ABC subunit B